LFLVYDLEKDTFTAVDNSVNMAAAQGAGLQAAQAVVSAGAAAVITGHVGPKAFQALSAAGVQVFTATAVTVAEALSLLERNELVELKAADALGRGGRGR